MPADVLDVAACEHDREAEDLIRQRAKRRSGQIHIALNRMLGASYWLCQACGTDIPIERLRGQPEATHYIACRAHVEARTTLKPGLSRRTSDRALRELSMDHRLPPASARGAVTFVDFLPKQPGLP